MMKWMKPLLAVAAGAIMLVPATVSASTEVKEPQLMEGKIPVPAGLLINSYRYMGKLKHFSIDAVTTSDDEYLDEMVVTYTHWVHIDLKSPDNLHIAVSGDTKIKEYYISGKNFLVYDGLTNYYGELEVPQGIDKALDFLFDKYDVKSPLANILYTDLDKRIPPKDKGFYFGVSEVDDIPCHHIGFVTPTQEFQVWIEQGEHPLIRKFIIVDKTLSYLPRSGTVLRWNITPEFGKNTFVFDKPEGAMRINIEPADEWEAQ
jgi:hypothetical protein